MQARLARLSSLKLKIRILYKLVRRCITVFSYGLIGRYLSFGFAFAWFWLGLAWLVSALLGLAWLWLGFGLAWLVSA